MQWIGSCHLHLDPYPKEKPRNFDEAVDPTPITPREMKLETPPDKTEFPYIFPLAYRKFLELQVEMVGSSLTSKQAAVIINYFPRAAFLRVKCFQLLFGSIIDFDHMRLILDGVFDQSERTEAIHRMGILNIYDSLHPNRYFRLDLRRWDHREWAKIVICLAVSEPGDNWVNATYRWGKYDEHVPGWELPKSWTESNEGGSAG